MKNASPANPALLPAAEYLVRSGAVSAEEMKTELRPLYDTASLAQRADFALWLSRQGMPKEGLTLITTQEASDDLSAFLARTDALARLSNWQGVLETTERQLRPMLASLDSIGAGTAADAELERLCANPEMADAAFTLLRERVGRTGGTAALEAAYKRAAEAAPGTPAVLDHGRYLELFRALQSIRTF